MKEDFLTYLDKKHESCIKNKKIKNKAYIQYSILKPIDMLVTENFYIAKKIKSRILLVHNNIWVDLTDYDIINIICELEENIAEKLVKAFKECYNNHWTNFLFKIDDKIFNGKGLNVEKFDLTKKFFLDADFEISLSDFLFIINMILYKDIEGQKYVEKERGILLVETTLIKYISLISYYKFNCVEAKEYLSFIDYPYVDRNKLLKVKTKMNKYDKRFSKNEFDKVIELW